MRLIPALAAVACRAAPALDAVDPPLGDPLGDVPITLTGRDLADAVVTVGGLPCADVVGDDTTLTCRTPAVPPGPVAVVVTTAGGEATTAWEAWSPAELPGARLFDARAGLTTGAPGTTYAWQRLTPSIAPDWRVRDGNTLTWLPSTGRMWMTGGWNGYQQPDGFSPVDPDLGGYPPQNTTDEVWSSADGVAWRLERPHGDGAFERRHAHATVRFRDALWMIGGDTHQGFYNHDVVTSGDGVSWRVAVADPPWEPRALQITGVYAGALWTGGGQTLLGEEADYVYHNDLWRSEDGVTWTPVAADGPATDTRWAGCGLVTGFVEFHGRMWLVGCARYREVAGHALSNEVWSTTDGVTWTRHADPPWAGKAWHDVVVWDGKLWALFGYTTGDTAGGWPAGNANEAWYSEDGETWRSLPHDAPVPGSHAQGVAVVDDAIVLAGGNYSFGFGAGVDPSVWRLVPHRGDQVTTWTDRGADALTVVAAGAPRRVDDALGPGRPGVVFDGSADVFALDGVDAQPDGRTVWWIARAPYLPAPWGWEETYAPVGTIVGGPDVDGLPNASVGLSDGAVALVNREPGVGDAGEPLWARVAGGDGLQEGPGDVRLAGLSHGADGAVTVWVDGAPVATTTASYASPRAWSRLGGSLDGDGYYGPNTRFAGALGAVLILPEVIDAETAGRVQVWARGRFGTP